MNRSFLIAGLITLGTVAWIASGQFEGDADAAAILKPPAEVPAEGAVTAVRVQDLTAAPHAREIVLRGATEARRLVDLKVETDGRVETLLVAEGVLVEASTPLLQLDPAERAARVSEAEALVAQRRIEQQGAVKLAKSGYRSEMEVAGAEAALQAAEAALEAARIELANATLKAPFRGVVERHLVEQGDFADRGEAVLRLVELDPLVIVAHASEDEILLLKQGDSGRARLSDGREFAGTLAYVARAGETATRSFRVELHVANPDGLLPAGITADLLVALPAEAAYKVSPAVLVLDSQGRLGVKAVDGENRVVFYPVAILDDATDGLWLGGLPPALRLIVVGQEFADVGEVVRPVQVAPKAGS